MSSAAATCGSVGGTSAQCDAEPEDRVRALLSMHGPDMSIAVPNREARDDVRTLQLGPEEQAADVAKFAAIVSAPITRQDQFYVATIDQHVASGEANPTWLLFRVGRCTGSVAGSIHGVNKYCSRKKQVLEMLWPTFKGNCMTAYGSAHEDDAAACFATWQSLRLMDEEVDADGFVLEDVGIETFGLCICRAFPQFAMSPDGFLVETWAKRIDQVPGAEGPVTAPGTEGAVAAPGTEGPVAAPGTEGVAGRGAEAAAGGATAAVPGPGAVLPRPNGIVHEARADGLYAVKTKRILIEYKCPWGKRQKNWYDEVDVYPLENIAKAEGQVLPVPSSYFAQCSYGMHVLGVLDDLLSEPEYAYFVVWHPAVYKDPFPDCWVAENTTKTAVTVACDHGTIQITRVPYLKKYCEALEASARTFWTEEYAPALWRKLMYGRPSVAAAAAEELDFEKKSYVAPRQRSIEDCLSGFSTFGTFAVATTAPAKAPAKAPARSGVGAAAGGVVGAGTGAGTVSMPFKRR